jgi:two-component system, chemotaxis family, chemotaxis protein CheY
MTTLLVVDDSTTMRKMIMAALRRLNPVFSEATNGLEAIEQLSLQPFHAVILDLNMPDMHGLEFLRFVRSSGALKNTPILVLTSRSDEAIRAEALSSGADVFMTKPFSPERLQTEVAGLISRSVEEEPPTSSSDRRNL